jgi:hypothetical protein
VGRLGGGLGSLLRWLTGRVIGEHYHGDFPVGTFVINVSGAFAIDYLSVLFKVELGLPVQFLTPPSGCSPLSSCEPPSAFQGSVLSANVTASSLSGGFAGALRDAICQSYLDLHTC